MSNASKVIPFDMLNPSSYIEESSMDVNGLKITATLFKSAYDNGKKEVETTWGELYEFLVNAPRYPSKKECEGLKLASFGDLRTNTALRNDKNVQQVFGVEIDYDAGEVTTTQAQEIFERAGLAAIIYTTYGHKPEEGIHKWRALLPLSKPIKGAERLEWWERVNNLVDGKLDPMLATRSQLVFYGNNGKNYEVRKVDGKPIDIAGANIPRRQKDNASTKAVDEFGNEVYIPTDVKVAEAIRQIYSNEHYYQPALSLAGIFYNKGMPREVAIATVKALLDAHPNPNGDIARYIASADNFLTTLSREEEESQKADVAVHKLGMDILEVAVPQHPFLIPDWLPLAAATLYAGNGGGGKSYTALEIGISLACGLNVLGYRTEPVSVVFLSGEDPYETIKWRAKQFIHSKKGEIDLTLLEQNFTVVDWTKEDQKIIFTMGGRGKDGAAFHQQAMDRLRNVIDACVPSLVIVDNDSNLFGGNEIDRSHVSNYVTGLVALAEMAAWLLLHHIDKGSARSGIMDAFSGSTAWNNAVRARWSIGKLDSGRTGIKVFKNNYGKIGASAEIEFNQSTLCFDIGQSYFPSYSGVKRERTLTLYIGRVVEKSGANGLRKSSKSKAASVFSEIKAIQPELGFDIVAGEVESAVAKMLGLGLLKEEFRTESKTKTKVPFVLLTEEGLTQIREAEDEE